MILLRKKPSLYSEIWQLMLFAKFKTDDVLKSIAIHLPPTFFTDFNFIANTIGNPLSGLSHCVSRKSFALSLWSCLVIIVCMVGN